MDIAKLNLLLDIAETKNLTLSAEHMGYTQSGVSHAIHKLEAEMGISLLNRTNKGVELTVEGELLLPHIRTISANYKRMDDILDSIHGLQKGSICIGTYSSVAAQWLPHVLKEFKEAYPNISITIREGGIQEIEQWLQEGSIDFGFLSQRKGQKYHFCPLAKDPLYVVTAKDYPIPKEYQSRFPARILGDYPYIASESGLDHDVAAALESTKVTPNITCRCSDDHTIVSMVASGLGISLLPSMFLVGQDERLNKILLVPCYMRNLGICTMPDRTLSLASKTFINVSKTVIEQLTQETDTSPFL